MSSDPERVITLPFAKYHGLGNDFVLVDARENTPLARASRGLVTPSAAERLCHRRRGVGADGVITLLAPRSPGAEVRMHIYNADGSVAEMCGNGLRTLVHFALRGKTGHLVVDTDAGRREGWLEADGRVRVTLGTARLIAEAIEADVDGAPHRGMGISMGNPHLVLAPFEDGADLRSLAERAGPALERHASFPNRVNVSFVRVAEAGAEGRAAITDVVFERGCGITDACGTGAAAAAVAMQRYGALAPGERVTVTLLGGPLEVFVRGDARRPAAGDDELAAVEILGDAVHVFDGTLELREEDFGETRP